MWISRKLFETLLHERSQAQGVAQALERQNIHWQATFDWLKTRMTQVEHERAILMKTYMGVSVPVPTIESEQTPSAFDFNQLPVFQDVGDAEAIKLGVGWNDAGEFVPNVRKDN